MHVCKVLFHVIPVEASLVIVISMPSSAVSASPAMTSLIGLASSASSSCRFAAATSCVASADGVGCSSASEPTLRLFPTPVGVGGGDGRAIGGCCGAWPAPLPPRQGDSCESCSNGAAPCLARFSIAPLGSALRSAATKLGSNGASCPDGVAAAPLDGPAPSSLPITVSVSLVSSWSLRSLGPA